ncbi:hypothetical protein DPEC_G00119650 [Dallia pectoralis]|uniref:Uncharacterized protein n=1 Tax=Dallia pectoralis TaxID=75939 RepID=A0ACC2GQ69_DALPE|nr:hypothetical protein DPEC_G00119650 [Dallia pectoralis]
MAPRLAALLLVVTVCLGYTQAFSDLPLDCCLVVTDMPFPRSFKVVAHLLQTTDRGCDIDATVFITKTGMRLCTPHPKDSAWVAKYIKRMEKVRN